MNFDDIDKQMRVFETSDDRCVLPDVYIVARIDGRNFTRLTKEVHKFDRPFDVRFRDYMLDTVEHLMTCGFQAIYGYTQSDEISILFHKNVDAFNRKIRKFNSVLAGEASAKFTLLLGSIGVFDCRVCELPNTRRVIDYFRWRQEDAHRNALNAHCYWNLRDQGTKVAEATNFLSGLSVAEKNELLFQSGTNFNDLPSWQKRGMGLLWENYEKPAINPKTQSEVIAIRRRVRREMELPLGDAYSNFISDLLTNSEQP